MSSLLFHCRSTPTASEIAAAASRPAGDLTIRTDAVVDDCGLPDLQAPDARQHDVGELPSDTLVFLLPSRYCEVDSELKDLAWKLFGHVTPGWPRVRAICEYVFGHVRFDYMLARNTRTAWDVSREQVGVCRDFMHLAITFCRCLNIPARYCTDTWAISVSRSRRTRWTSVPGLRPSSAGSGTPSMPGTMSRGLGGPHGPWTRRGRCRADHDLWRE